ncbi:hypothetical protein ACRAWG_16290 [Methylobacterium sp. P31]
MTSIVTVTVTVIVTCIVTIGRFVEKIGFFAAGRGPFWVALALAGPRGRGGPHASRILRLRGAQHVLAQDLVIVAAVCAEDEAAQGHRSHLLPACAGPRKGGEQPVVIGQRAVRFNGTLTIDG